MAIIKSTPLFPLLCPLVVFTGLAQPVQQIVPPDQAADGVYRVIERGPHHRTWERIVEVEDENGFLKPEAHSYVELATGMHVWDEEKQQWTEASDEIEILQESAVARKSQHKVTFSGNLNDPNGTIDILMPNENHLITKCIGLAYTEYDTGNSVFIGETKDSQGFVLGRNQVIYLDGFDSVKADVRYRTTRSTFAADVILREKLPEPGDFGLRPEMAKLEVWTAILNEDAQPEITPLPGKDGQDKGDVILDFGAMRIGRGKAFSLTEQEPPNPLGLGGDSIRVSKEWSVIQGQRYLIESVPYLQVKPKLDNLPPPQAAAKTSRRRGENSLTKVNHATTRTLPVSVGQAVSAQRVEKALRVAKLTEAPKKPGYVLDWEGLNGDQVDFRFKAGITYYVTGPVILVGQTVIEGGSVIKYDRWSSTNTTYLEVYGPSSKWLTSAYRPVVFTGKDDDSVGEIIDASTGTLTGEYAWFAIYNDFETTPTVAEHVQIRHALYGYMVVGSNGDVLRNAQFINCVNGVLTEAGSLDLENVLIQNASKALYADTDAYGSSDTIINGINLTINGAAYATYGLGGESNGFPKFNITNSLFIGVTTSIAPPVGTFSGAYNATNSSASSVFQTVRGGAHYLADNSYRNIGTANIGAELLGQLKKKTTYPPLDLTSPFVSSTTLSPQAQRDTDTPDLGYHYDPLDYLVSNAGLTGVTVTLTNGVAVGTYGTVGFQLYAGAKVISEGTPNNLNRLVRYRTVQESALSTNDPASYTIYCPDSYSPAPEVRLRFTDLSLLPGNTTNSAHIYSPASGGMVVNLRDCWLRGGGLTAVTSSGLALDLNNCLFDRANCLIQGDTVNLYNNTFLGGAAIFSSSAGQTYKVKDNLFDKTTVSKGASGTWNHGYNGYVTNYSRLGAGSGTDVILPASPDYQTGTLGRFYLPNGIALIDVGSRTAPNAGLYHHTTQTNQTQETTTQVDIGFHYIALDGNGNPNDYDSDGIPDYLEDGNGDGSTTPDFGETKWQEATDLSFNVFITEPKANSNVP